MEASNFIPLSQAIRLGCVLSTGQAFGVLSDGKRRTCAWGSAYQAIGVIDSAGEIDEEKCKVIPQMWDVVAAHSPVVCPVNGCDKVPAALMSAVNAGTTITHLNDVHRWSRERIADWVESIEREISLNYEIIDPPISEFESEELEPLTK